MTATSHIEKSAETLPFQSQDRESARIRAKDHHATGIPMATVAFRVTLTHTTNEYLKDRLPLHGLVKIHERDIYGRCQFVTFMPDPEPGKYATFVEVPEAEFTVMANR